MMVMCVTLGWIYYLLVISSIYRVILLITEGSTLMSSKFMVTGWINAGEACIGRWWSIKVDGPGNFLKVDGPGNFLKVDGPGNFLKVDGPGISQQ